MPLPPPISAPARQTIKAAFEDLDRTITPADSRDFRVSTLAQVRDAALEIERQLAARGSLRNMRRLMPLFRGIEHYSKVIDVLCNGTPYLPWIWAPIALILRVASEYVDAFEQIIKGYSQLAESLGRFELLGNAFLGDSEFQQTLAVFYADILQFHKHAYKFVRRSGWKLLFLTTWGRFQRRFDNILEDMKRHEALIDREANARNIAESKEMRQDIRRWREQSLEQVSNLDGEEAAKQYQSIISWLNMDESDQLAIFESISAEGRKHPGTCSWVLKNPKISSWLQSKPDMSVLWLQGTPGSGKSVISTQLVNFMQASNMFVIHHFCTYLYTSSTTYEQILKSLLMQLLRKDGDLVAHVYEEFVLGKKSPTVPALERLLQLLFKSISNEPSKAEYVWIILDGLDECELEKQARVVSLMNQVASDRSSPGNTTCKVLISSRTSSILSNCLRKKQTVSLSDEKDCLEEAIRQYASQRLQSLEQKFHQLHISPGEVDHIVRGIAKKADGMFLYARLVLDYLSTNIFYSGDEIMTSVNQLPEKLGDFYRKILLQILTHLDIRSENRVKSILSWIAFAKRPLKRLELLSAITFSSGDPEVTNLVPEYILDICGPLLEERGDTTLTFIHVSVKEFLQTPSSSLTITQEESLQEHGVATVSCLLSGLQVFSKVYPEQARYLRVIKGLHGFHVYATEFWTEYLLSSVKFPRGDPENTSPLLVLACKLADTLSETSSPAISEEAKSPPNGLNDRMSFLRQHPILYEHVEAALKGRSLKRLEAELFPETNLDGTWRSPKKLAPLDGISAMLTVYQDTVRSLLDQHDYPGVTAEELELFKSQFRTSAFTCRLKSCPRATLGFESEKHCLQHEMTHIRRLRCTAADCKFPPFVSPQALKMHTSKYHSHGLLPKSIRSIQVSPKTIGILVYQKNPSDTRQNESLPQKADQKAQEGQAKRKLTVQHNEDSSNSALSSVDQSATDTASSTTPQFFPIYCSFPNCVNITDESFNSLCAAHVDHYQAFAKKDLDLESTESAPSTLQTIVETSGEDLTPPDEPSVGRNVTSLEVLADENLEQMAKLQLPEGTDAYVTSTLTNGQIQSPTSTSPVAEPNLSVFGPPPPMTPGISIEKLDDEWDEEGEKKIFHTGRLSGSRKYRCPTFLWPNQGDDLYMLDMDCRRILKDQYTQFIQRGGWLAPIHVKSSDEKRFLMTQTLFYHAYSYEYVTIVKARNVFRQFGHRVIEGGRPVHDDYRVADARKQLKDIKMMQIEDILSGNDRIKKRFGIVARRSVVQAAKLVSERHLDAKATAYGGIENIPNDEIANIMDNALAHLEQTYKF
ncbi:NACHT domain-containing protein [Trichoderma simmonsii]|uniref:NACHT domain-containing protein n=1 Tax=Trichoderma simmonsii TaxID=1491479 RepID=A0A8G0KZB7_9HYPO|nr:NACHT domain-containing protein [Trichoderma simmonsii]